MPGFDLSFFEARVTRNDVLPSKGVPCRMFVPTCESRVLSSAMVICNGISRMRLILGNGAVEQRATSGNPSDSCVPMPGKNGNGGLRFPPFAFCKMPGREKMLGTINCRRKGGITRCAIGAPKIPRHLSVACFRDNGPTAGGSLLVMCIEVLSGRKMLYPIGKVPMRLSMRKKRVMNPASCPLRTKITSFLIEANRVSGVGVETADGRFSACGGVGVGGDL